MGKQKRERSVNFTQEETNFLVSLAVAKRHIIENKKSDATTWQEKENAWKDIAKVFNSAFGSVFRDHKHLKIKYEGIKRDIRKKSAMVRAGRDKTVGGTRTTTRLTPAEIKVKEMILHSVEGNKSELDSDMVLSNTSTSSSVKTWMHAEELGDQAAESIVIEIQEHDMEPAKRKVCSDTQEETLLQSKPKEENPFDRLTEEKLEIAKIQRKLLTEELEHKFIQRKIFEKELEHKEIIQELEKQHLLLKIELLKKQLEEK